MKIKAGEVFSIKTNIGFGFIQYITTGDLGVELVRVLEPIKQTEQITQQEVDLKERYSVHFAVKPALSRKIIQSAGELLIPANYKIPTHARTEHNVRGEFLGWHIIDQQTLKRELRQELNSEEILLSPHGHPNATLLIEWLEKDWRLENWK